MARGAAKAVYTSDQRNLVVSFWALRTGGTSYSVTWRHCLAGEETLREVVLLKGTWKATLHSPWQAIRALVWVARAMEQHKAAEKS